MTITHQIVDKDPNGDNAPPIGGDILSQLNGLIGQAQGLLNGSVGLSAIQNIGSQISKMGSSIQGAGGTTVVSNAITGLGSQLSISSMANMSGILSSLNSQLSTLTSMINPKGLMSQVLHLHSLDKSDGIKHSAFQGKHTVSLGSGGIDISSATKVAATAPTLPHNGLTTVSDALQVTKGISGQSFNMLSDRKLKKNIKSFPSVLEKIMLLKLKTFDVKSMDWENEIPLPEYHSSFGLIAQEVQEVFPEVVKEGKYLSIEESKVGLLLLAAFQEFVIEVREELEEMTKEIMIR